MTGHSAEHPTDYPHGAATEVATAEEVLCFWFEECRPEQWFTKDDAFDRRLAAQFAATVDAAAGGGLDSWADSAEGCLALCLVLDQFPRNLYRDDPRAYALDERARAAARTALDRGYDLALPTERRVFVYLPFEHSEDLDDQHLSVSLCRERTGSDAYTDYAVRHLEVIERFGRFPHRNAVLGRTNTEEEIAFLAQEGSRF